MCLIIVTPVLFLILSYESPPHNHKDNWNKDVKVSLKSGSIKEVVDYANENYPGSQLARITATLDKNEEITSIIYCFYCQKKGGLPNGMLSIRVNTAAMEIQKIDMEYTERDLQSELCLFSSVEEAENFKKIAFQSIETLSEEESDFYRLDVCWNGKRFWMIAWRYGTDKDEFPTGITWIEGRNFESKDEFSRCK